MAENGAENGRVTWDAAKVEAGLAAATRIVKLWSAGQRAPNHHQRRQLGLAPELKEKRAQLIVPTPQDLAEAEAVLACLDAIGDLHLRRLLRARAGGASLARLQAIDARSVEGIRKALRKAYNELALHLNKIAPQIPTQAQRSEHAA